MVVLQFIDPQAYQFLVAKQGESYYKRYFDEDGSNTKLLDNDQKIRQVVVFFDFQIAFVN